VSTPAGSTVALTSAVSVAASFGVDVSGTYVVQLVVDDGLDVSDPDMVSISTLNYLPVAEAGADQAVFVGELVSLDGTGSTDADGDPLSFGRRFVIQPAGSAASLDDASVVTPALWWTYAALMSCN